MTELWEVRALGSQSQAGCKLAPQQTAAAVCDESRKFGAKDDVPKKLEFVIDYDGGSKGWGWGHKDHKEALQGKLPVCCVWLGLEGWHKRIGNRIYLVRTEGRRRT